MARLIIKLHEEGYNSDFELFGDDRVWGIQEERFYVLDEININKMYQIGRHVGKCAKFILALETGDGCKGLLVVITRERGDLNYKGETLNDETRIECGYNNALLFADLKHIVWLCSSS